MERRRIYREGKWQREYNEEEWTAQVKGEVIDRKVKQMNENHVYMYMYMHHLFTNCCSLLQASEMNLLTLNE